MWSIYSGAQYAPFGGVQQDGVRLRIVGGYGDHATGTVAFTDVLAGYHLQLGTLTIKFFAGLMAEDRHADGPDASLDGADWGGKAVLETWWTITDHAWLSADVSFGSLNTAFSSRARLGWRMLPELSVGLEGGVVSALEREIARAGGFVRYEWQTGEASLSAGMAFDGLDNDWNGPHSGPFGTVSVLMRF